MNGIIELKLKVFREFQLANTTAHLGGSLGLMIRGIDLLRDLSRSDLDVTVDEYYRSNLEKDALELSSDFNDFDFCTRKQVQDNGNYVKMDIRVTPEPSFDFTMLSHFLICSLSSILVCFCTRASYCREKRIKKVKIFLILRR